MLVLAVGGCAGGPERRVVGADAPRVVPVVAPREALRAAAQSEALAAPAPGLDVPIPAGVGPQALTERSSDDARAWLPVEEVLRVLAQGAEAPRPATPVVEPTAEAAAEAARHYVTGRQAALQGRYLQAVTELRQARELDPGSPAVLRELARCYAAVRSMAASIEAYEQLLILAEHDAEAILAVALHAANAREYRRAGALLARLTLGSPGAGQDAAARIIAQYALCTCLRHEGFDRAGIQAARAMLESEQWQDAAEAAGSAGQNPLHASRLGSIYAQRPELWREIGDGHCRLGEYELAAAAYATASSLSSTVSAALPPRQTYALLRLGQVFAAQQVVLAALDDAAGLNLTPSADEAPVAAEGPAVRPPPEAGSEQAAHLLAPLCAYLARHSPTAEPMVGAVVEAHQQRPDDAGMARAAAALLPADQAVALLRRFVRDHPDDGMALGDLLQRLDQQHPRLAAELAVAVVDAQPSRVRVCGARWAEAAARPGRSLQALAGMARTPSRSAVESSLRLALEDYGGAWQACVRGLARWPGHEALLQVHLAIAAAVEEPSLVSEAAPGVERLDGAELWLALTSAYLAVDDLDGAAAAAQAVMRLEPNHPGGLLALARIAARRAGPASSDQRAQAVAHAIELVQRAIEHDPSAEEPYGVLLTIYQPQGPGEDPRLLAQTARGLAARHPDGPLLALITGQDAIAQSRYDEALDALLRLYDSDPTSQEALRLAVLAWHGRASGPEAAAQPPSSRLDAAVAWFEQQLVRRPGNRTLLEQWAQLMVRQDRGPDALERLQGLAADDPGNPALVDVIEQICWRLNRRDEAIAMAQARLSKWPAGAHRALALAVAHLGAGRSQEAVAELAWIRDRSDQVRLSHYRAALDLLQRIDRSVPGRDALRVQVGLNVVTLFPEASWTVYAQTLEALALAGPLDERFDSTARQAMRRCPDVAQVTVTATARWRQVAQQLVDAQSPRAAGRLLRLRLRTEPTPDSLGWRVFGNAAFAADAAAGVTGPSQADASVALLDEIALAGRLSDVWPWLDQPVTPTDAAYQVSAIYTVVGETAGAQTLLMKTINLQPDHVMALNNLGYQRLEDGINDAETVAYIEKAAALDGSNQSILDTLGWLRYRQGRFQDEAGEAAPGPGLATEGAVTLLRRAAAGSPQPSPEVFDHLGDALWRIADRMGARDAWSRAQAILDAPDHRARYLQMAATMQSQLWSLLVIDPEQAYEREYGDMHRRLDEKVRAVDQRQSPQVALTFAELADRE